MPCRSVYLSPVPFAHKSNSPTIRCLHLPTECEFPAIESRDNLAHCLGMAGLRASRVTLKREFSSTRALAAPVEDGMMFSEAQRPPRQS